MSKKVEKFKCTSCEYTTSNKQRLSQHIVEVHERKKPFKCDICDYSWTRITVLKEHIQLLHEGEMKFKCENCEYNTSIKKKFEHTYCRSSWRETNIQMWQM